MAKTAIEAVKKAGEEFVSCMDDDLNTADAITAIFNLVRDANTSVANANASDSALKAALDKLVELTDVLGIEAETEDPVPQEVMDLVQKRAEAKKAKDFALADSLRNQITSMGYSVKDTANGPQVEKL